MSLPRLRRGRPVSASALNQWARAIDGRRQGGAQGALVLGDARFDPADEDLGPFFAVIDDAAARPIAAGDAYTVALVDASGDKIPGSVMAAYAMDGNLYVPDEALILIALVDGVWGFLRALTWEAIADEGTCTQVDENQPAVALGVGLADIYKLDGAATERRLYVHFTRPRAYAYGMMDVVGDDSAADNVASTGPHSVRVEPVHEDWDPATLTWNNKPALLGVTELRIQGSNRITGLILSPAAPVLAYGWVIFITADAGGASATFTPAQLKGFVLLP